MNQYFSVHCLFCKLHHFYDKKSVFSGNQMSHPLQIWKFELIIFSHSINLTTISGQQNFSGYLYYL